MKIDFMDLNQGVDDDDRKYGYIGITDKGGQFFTWMDTLRETIDSIEDDHVDPPATGLSGHIKMFAALFAVNGRTGKGANMRQPRIIVTSDRWSRNTVMVFEDETDFSCIPDDWINDRMENTGCDYDTALAEMVEEFIDDNDIDDEYWSGKKICRSGNRFFRYEESGGYVEYIGDDIDITEVDE